MTMTMTTTSYLMLITIVAVIGIMLAYNGIRHEQKHGDGIVSELIVGFHASCIGFCTFMLAVHFLSTLSL